MPDRIRLFRSSEEEKLDTGFSKDYAIRISDLQTVVSRLDKIVYKGKKEIGEVHSMIYIERLFVCMEVIWWK